MPKETRLQTRMLSLKREAIPRKIKMEIAAAAGVRLL